MTERLFQELQSRGPKDIIEFYVARDSSLNQVIARIIEDLTRDSVGETISYTLAYALSRLIKVGYGAKEIEDEFRGTAFGDQVRKFFEKENNHPQAIPTIPNTSS